MGKVISFKRREAIAVSEHAEESMAKLLRLRRDLATWAMVVDEALTNQRVVTRFLERLDGPDAA